MKVLYFFLVSCLVINHCFSQQFPPGFAPQQLIENIDPTDFIIGKDGRIFITIKSGKILVAENEQLTPNVFLDIEDQVDNYNERGLGHMVLDPDFETNHYYYVYYTVKNENRNRISRFTANGNSTLPGSEHIILNLNTMFGTIHNAGAMVFGPDGKLYVSVGDGTNAGEAQSPSTLLGKILRMNPDGSAPADNPFYDNPTYTGVNKLIYASGFRNPFSMDIQPGTGKIYACEVGNSEWEEINEILPGKNYGWPVVEGFLTNEIPPPDYQDPVYAYSHENACAILGACFYNPAQSQFPPEYTGKFFFSDYCAGYMKYIDPATGVVQPFGTGIDRPLAIRMDPRTGTFYFLQRAGMGGGTDEDNTSSPDGSLWKITFNGSGEPIIASQPEDILVSTGEDATFSVSASGTAPLAYQWMRDGDDIGGAGSNTYAVENAQLSDDGSVFSCRISNSAGEVTSEEAELSVTSNSRPVPQITSPGNDFLYRAGENIRFAGKATDEEDGSLPKANLTWRIDFHHDTHNHPALSTTSGISSGEYMVPRIGETEDNVWYRIYLTATDEDGFSKTIHKDVFPKKTTFQLTTKPSGLTLNLDGQPVQTPVVITSVVGITRTLGAPQLQYKDNEIYVYDKWSEPDLERIFTFNVPGNGASYRGEFTFIPPGYGEGLQASYYNQSRTFNGDPDLVRVDETINFNWEEDSPDPAINNDFFTARWEGYIMPQFTDTYTFYTFSDDGVRLWVNNQLLIDKWDAQSPTEWSATYAVEAFEKYPVKLEFFEDGSEAIVRFLWKSSLLPKQVVRKRQLFTTLVTGIEDPSATVFLYPTVASTNITVKRTEMANTEWRIYNILGQPVLQGNFSEEPLTEIQVANLSPGVYLFKTFNGKERIIRFLKQ